MSYGKQTSIDKPQCPEGHGDMELTKTWEVKAKGGRTTEERQRRQNKTGFRIELWTCPTCGVSTRIPRKLIKKGDKKQ